MLAAFQSSARGPSARYTLVVLGGGMAAVAAARDAVRRGARVALLAPHDVAPDLAETSEYSIAIRRHQDAVGLRTPPLPVDEPRIDVFRGPVRFSRYRAVTVGDVEVRFGTAVIATGAEPGPVAIAGAAAAAPLRPLELVRLNAPPSRLAVVGSDGMACFWAQQLQRLGSEVHLIVAEPRLLGASDERAAGLVRGQLQQQGVRIRTGCEEVALDRTGNRRGVLMRRGGQPEKLLVDQVLVCPRPQPRIADLALETASVTYTARGIAVDAWLRTSERHVFAAGGACGGHYASPEAEMATGRLAAQNALAWLPRRLSRCVIPRYMPTDPPIVELGLRPAEAAAAEIATELRCIEFHELGLAVAGGGRHGCIVLHLGRDGLLVGGTIAAVGAEELALPLMLLMTHRWPIHALGELTPCRSGRARLLMALAK